MNCVRNLRMHIGFFVRIRRFGTGYKSNFELIYDLPYARVGSTVNRLKLIQTVCSGIAVPVVAALEYQTVLPSGVFLVSLYSGIVVNLACYSIGHLFYRLIGKVYLDQEKGIARFSYVGFFGKRQNVDVPIEDVIPSDAAPGYLFSKVHFLNRKPVSYLKLQEKYFEYCNYNLARTVFGESFMRFSR